jgi:hypothetical protein
MSIASSTELTDNSLVFRTAEGYPLFSLRGCKIYARLEGGTPENPDYIQFSYACTNQSAPGVSVADFMTIRPINETEFFYAQVNLGCVDNADTTQTDVYIYMTRDVVLSLLDKYLPQQKGTSV